MEPRAAHDHPVSVGYLHIAKASAQIGIDLVVQKPFPVFSGYGDNVVQVDVVLHRFFHYLLKRGHTETAPAVSVGDVIGFNLQPVKITVGFVCHQSKIIENVVFLKPDNVDPDLHMTVGIPVSATEGNTTGQNVVGNAGISDAVNRFFQGFNLVPASKIAAGVQRHKLCRSDNGCFVGHVLLPPNVHFSLSAPNIICPYSGRPRRTQNILPQPREFGRLSCRPQASCRHARSRYAP